MGTRQHLHSTAWPISDFPQRRKQCRERRLALVMGFNGKCGATSETGREGGLGGGGGGAQKER